MSEKYIIERIKQHQDSVNSVAVTPDGRSLYSVASDGSLHGYWTRSYALSMSNSHSGIGQLTSLAISPDGKLLATGSTNNKVLIWNLSIVGDVKECVGHVGPVTAVAFTPDGKNVLSAGGMNDQSIRKWEAETQKLKVTYQITNYPINDLALSANGGTGFVANGNEITVFEVPNGAVIERIQAHEGRINAVSISPDNSEFITGGEDGFMKVWSCYNLELYKKFSGNTRPVKTVAISPDSKYWVYTTGASDSGENKIFIIDSESCSLIKELVGHHMSINSLTFTIDAKHLISGSSDRTIIIWDFSKIIEDYKQKQLKQVETIPTLEGVENQAKKVELYKKFSPLGMLMENEKFKEAIGLVNEIKEEANSYGIEEIIPICDNILNSISGLPDLMEQQKNNQKRLKLHQKVEKISNLIAEERFEKAKEKAEKAKSKALKYRFTDLVQSLDLLLDQIKKIPPLEQRLLTKARELKTKEKPDTPTEVESMEPLTELLIPIEKIFYDKSSKRLSFNLPYFTFIGHYPKTTLLSEVLDDMYDSLGKVKLTRKNIYLVDSLREKHLAEDIRIKDLKILDEEERDKKIEREKLADRLLTQAVLMDDSSLTAPFEEKISQVQEKLARIEEKAEDAKKLKEAAEELNYKLSRADSEMRRIVKKKYEEREKQEQWTKDLAQQLRILKPGAPGGSPPMEAKIPEKDSTGGLPPPRSPVPPSGPPTVRKTEYMELKSIKKKFGTKGKKKIEKKPKGAPMVPSTSTGSTPKRREAPRPKPPPPAGESMKSIFTPPEPSKTQASAIKEELAYGASRDDMIETEPIEKTYDINMGLQYYSCMMEKQSYLFYVYFSHKELVIEDEEGKVVYQTTFQIVTTKEEPPQLDLRVEGKGFEIHPISATLEVDEDAESQSLIIFSIYVKKSKGKSKKEKKEGEKRHLHIHIEFEDKNVSHTILSVLVQPKHFSLDLGPFHMNISKTQAMFVSFIPLLITLISTIYAISQLDLSGASSSSSALGGIIPGAGSIGFLLTFIYTLLKKGIFPMKQKVSGFLDFDKTPAVLK